MGDLIWFAFPLFAFFMVKNPQEIIFISRRSKTGK
jgi:hypothetical protein